MGSSYDTRSIDRPVYLGGYEEFEVTLLLRPGWLPHLQLDNLESGDDPAEDKADALRYWNAQFKLPDINHETLEPNSIYHGKHADFHTVRHVARLWIFPDDHRHMDPGDPPTESPYARDNWPADLYSPYDPNPDRLIYAHPTLGAGIADAAYWVPRRRPFGDTIGRRKEASVRAPVVWINFDATDPETGLAQPGWLPLSGGYRVDELRAAVYLDLDNLRYDSYLLGIPELVWGVHNYLRAFIYGSLQMAISGTIRGDGRMYHAPTVEGGGSSRRRFQVHDYGFDEYQKRTRSYNVFADKFVADDDNEDSEYRSRDDTERMEGFGKRDADFKKLDTVSGSVELFWLDKRYRVGDSFTGVEGLGITFNSRPVIRRIQWINVPGAGHRTALHLSDLRHDPEVGAEAAA